MNKCSVVLALYNGKKYIKEQLDSIINQTVKPNEIIILDDKSTDGSYEYVKKYITNLCKKSKCNIRLFKNAKNLGYVKTFSKLLKLAKYDTIFLSDQDDVWFENKIEDHLKIYEKNRKVLAISSQMIITDSNLSVFSKKKEDNKLELIDVKKACFGAKMFYGCQLSIKKTKNFTKLISALNNDNVDVHDRLICYYYAGINGLYYYHKNHLFHRIHKDNAIGHDNMHKVKSSYDIRISQARKDLNIITYYKKLLDKKIFDFTDKKNKIYIDELIDFRYKRLQILKEKNKFNILRFALKNYKYYSRKRVFFGDIYYSLKVK